MNESSKLKAPMSTISDWLASATETLARAGIPSARLDAEILLGSTLSRNRSWLIAHGDEQLSSQAIEQANNRLHQRASRLPIAYITGYKEFYGRCFRVTKDTLIPRPESETLIDLLKSYMPSHNTSLLDIGTGTGCLATTAALEFPDLQVAACDISLSALAVANDNAKNLQATVVFTQSDLLTAYVEQNQQFDIILANLPYVDKHWERSPETDYEPSLALFAKDKGLALVKQCIVQAWSVLTSHGLLLLEADPCQHDDIADFAQKYDYRLKDKDGYCLVFQKYD